MLSPGAGTPIETGLSMAMAAGGGRGQLVGGSSDDGFGLAFKADALWVGMRTEAGSGPGGKLKATQATVTRFRTALEGSRRMTVASRLSVTPSIELGVRQDAATPTSGPASTSEPASCWPTRSPDSPSTSASAGC